MKRGIRIFLALLAFNFFAQVCFAPYTINPDIPDKINPERPESNPDEVQKVDRTGRIIIWTIVVVAGLGIIVFLVAFILLLQLPWEGNV